MSSSSITINSNLASLQAQRQLSQTNKGLQKTFERLSSGMRIVRASDDAAGLSIASSLDNDNRVYTQGIRNLNDGVSYLNIADGAIDQLKAIVTRCRELATQAANGTMTSTQRNALDQESQALSKEYNRILATTEFNGSKVFDAANAAVRVQCGYGENEAISARTGEGVITAETTRVNTTSMDGEATGGTSGLPSLSADGRYIAFGSAATNLAAGDTNGAEDIFLKDLQTGAIQRISTASTGAQSNSSSYNAAITPDGRYIAFHSWATNLVPGDANGIYDVFVKDLQTGDIQRVSTTSAGGEATGGYSYYASISAEGRYVAFESEATNLVPGDTNAIRDVFVKDLTTGSIQRVSTTSAGAQGTGGSCVNAEISADGRYVVFDSWKTNLVSGDSNGISDIFVKDLQTGSIERINTTAAGGQAAGGDSSVSSISADGRYITFSSSATNLVPGDSNGQSDVFIKDLQTGAIQRLNTTAAGGEATGGSSFGGSISADGRYVMFSSSATNLVSGDTNGQSDVFVKDLQTGAIQRLSTTAAGGEASGGASGGASISADARYVVFQATATNLVPGDSNGTQDIFIVNNTLQSSAAGFESVVRPLVGIYLKDRTRAQMAQGTLDDYLDELNTAAGFIGSAMSRFSIAVSALGVRTENIAAAASRITDVDVADESSDLTRRNILQQAASAVLAQANLQPQIALSLLR